MPKIFLYMTLYQLRNNYGGGIRLYWHNQSYDEIKDSIVLDVRPDVIGIIRVSCEYFKQNKITIIKKLNNAINQIKSKECNRIKLY